MHEEDAPITAHGSKRELSDPNKKKKPCRMQSFHVRLLHLDVEVQLVVAQTLLKSGFDAFLVLPAAQNELFSAMPAPYSHFDPRCVH
jgi:hypothetical protein